MIKFSRIKRKMYVNFFRILECIALQDIESEKESIRKNARIQRIKDKKPKIVKVGEYHGF